MDRMDQPATLTIAVSHLPRVHYAMQQNDVPIVGELTVTNAGAHDLVDLDVRITIDGGLAKPRHLHVDRIPAGGTWRLGPLALELDGEVLVRQTEREKTRLRVRVTTKDALIAEHDASIEILAYDEWSGLDTLPEILAAFVQPNHPDVARVLSAASAQLLRTTGSGSLAGYQDRDPRRVRAIVAAIHAAIADLRIAYANPPAGFEQAGQRVRSPNRIVESKFATCLDLATWYAACFEQAGLHALVLLVQGHAFAGAWTHDESFAEAALDDGLRVKKRVELGEIVVVETTCATDAAGPSFEHAENAARVRFADLSQFLVALDVSAARRARIRPLPHRIAAERFANASTPESAPELDVAGSLPQAQPHPSTPAPAPGSTPGPARGPAPGPAAATDAASAETPHARLERWKRKLLDLSLRNRLLNFRETKRAVPLVHIDVSALENALAAGASFTVRSREQLEKLRGPRDATLHRERTGADLVEAFVADELAHGRLYADLDADTLDTRLVHSFREARVELEESGATTLFLALGFLVWFETPTSNDARRAPILLLPLVIERASVREAFRLRLAEDDPRINETLLEKLRAEFPHIDTHGLDELPEDESGLDVKAVLDRFRVAVKDEPRFEVEDRAVVGSFSFAKFLMWLDLQARSATLMQAPVVRHLVERPGQRFAADVRFATPEQLDLQWQPARAFCPLDADSSQLAAVATATAGASFVLQGPPGTGKSQTIANLIAQALAEGKRVLFVAEKRAALSVVHERLKKVGIDPFCLELHSNKISKTLVLEQLEAALDAELGGTPSITSAAALAEVREQLNAYVDASHRVRPLGLSVYTARAQALALSSAPELPLRFDAPETIEAATLDAAAAALEPLPAAIDAAGSPHGHPLTGLRCTAWASTLPQRLDAAAEALDASIRALHTALAPWLAAIGWMSPSGPTSLSRSQARALAELATTVAATCGPAHEMVTEPGFAELKPQWLAAIARGRERDALASALRARWRDAFLTADPASWRAKLTAARDALPVVRWFKLRAVHGELRPHFASGQPDDDTMLADFDAIDALRRETEALRTLPAARAFGARFTVDGADWAALEGVVAYVEMLRARLARVATGDVVFDANVRDRVATLVSTGRDAVAAGAPLATAISALAVRFREFEAARTTFATEFCVDAEAALERPDAALSDVCAELARWRAGKGGLREWCHWQTVRERVSGAAHPGLVTAIEAGTLRPADAHDAYRRALLRAWLDATIDADPVLRPFIAREHERKIARFRELDTRSLGEAASAVGALLAARVPRLQGQASESSEVGLLLREIAKKRRRLPVRRLIEKLPTLLPRLKPCFLMSPLSVAQMLDPAIPQFDLVVFDEASQIPVWDAIGAMARGANVVVVGDSKQLPPTNFFQKLEDGDEEPDEDEIEELESILDECVVSGLAEMSLRWHYRSRHESLIAFSNAHYYGNSLLTFPGPAHAVDGLGVRLVHLDDARYDRAQSRANRKEAEAVVADLLARLAAKPDESIGVVTFSQAQQTLIEDLLDRELRTRPELERFFTDAVAEPTFVKNLENVQGDERDVILFSVCYGPDEQGKVAMNFGPLNREGGERRLNVAITRARRQVVVFTCLHPDRIDLARTRAVGVQHLKTFLDYARRGPLAIAKATTLPRGGATESPFEAQVLAALVAKGHAIDAQVGCSGYRIDLAVKDPEHPGRYVLGIECDGAFYHRAATARDRDRLRADVLRRLGWTLHRVWSTDWFSDPAKELARLEAAIAAASASARESRSAAAIAAPVITASATTLPDAAPAAAGDGSASSATPTRAPSESEPAVDPEPTPSTPTRPAEAAAPTAPAAVGPHEPTPGVRMERYVPYRRGRPLGTATDLPTAGSDPRARDAFCAIVLAEAPVRHDLALERLAGLYQVGRVTQRVLDQLDPVARAVLDAGQVRLVDGVLWTTAQDPAAWRAFRTPTDEGAAARSAEELPDVEIANAAAWILAQQLSLDVDDLLREVARLFGYARLGSTVKARMDVGLRALVARGEAALDGRRATIVEARRTAKS